VTLKQRKPIARKTGMPQRTTRINPRNRKRHAKEVERTYGEYATFVTSQPCVIPGCGAWPVDPAHVKGGGAGMKSDAQFLAPLCKVNVGRGYEGHHRESHRIGIETFQRKYNIDLDAAAASMWAEWMENRA
jgi:hypothetical protein